MNLTALIGKPIPAEVYKTWYTGPPIKEEPSSDDAPDVAVNVEDLEDVDREDDDSVGSKDNYSFAHSSEDEGIRQRHTQAKRNRESDSDDEVPVTKKQRASEYSFDVHRQYLNY